MKNKFEVNFLSCFTKKVRFYQGKESRVRLTFTESYSPSKTQFTYLVFAEQLLNEAWIHFNETFH